METKGAPSSIDAEKQHVEHIEDEKLALENTNSVMTDDLSSDTPAEWDSTEEKRIVLVHCRPINHDNDANMRRKQTDRPPPSPYPRCDVCHLPH